MQKITKESPNRLYSMDRREVLKICATLVSGGALSTISPGCHVTKKPVFENGDVRVFAKESKTIAQTMLSFVSETTTNEDAMKKSADLVEKVGLSGSTMYGAITDINQVGHVLLFQGGTGFIRFEVHNDKKYYEPLILRRGQDPISRTRLNGVGCSLTKVCTNSMNPSGEQIGHDFEDLGAEDPPCGVFSGYFVMVREPFPSNEIDLLSAILEKSAVLLEPGGDTDVAILQKWLNEKKASIPGIQAYVGTTTQNGVTWYDWLVQFSNESSSVVQVAKGTARPIFSFKEGNIDMSKVSLSYDSVETNVPDETIFFPHVTQTR